LADKTFAVKFLPNVLKESLTIARCKLWNLNHSRKFLNYCFIINQVSLKLFFLSDSHIIWRNSYFPPKLTCTGRQTHTTQQLIALRRKFKNLKRKKRIKYLLIFQSEKRENLYVLFYLFPTITMSSRPKYFCLDMSTYWVYNKSSSSVPLFRFAQSALNI